MKQALLVLVLLFGVMGIVVAGDYEDGKNSVNQKDDAADFKGYLKAAEAGDVNAQSKLGMMYANGKGVAQDDSEAVRWWRKASEAGDADAQNNLGVMYDEGRGVSQNFVQAVHWFSQAAEAGFTIAQYNLGWMYANGRGVQHDDMEAHKWLNIAAVTATSETVRDAAISAREHIAQELSRPGLAEAERLAREWVMKIGQD
tara:strand:+ start:2710 stop:3309 length:600 start_codon:yes stop_codon:yes gene_type:complete